MHRRAGAGWMHLVFVVVLTASLAGVWWLASRMGAGEEIRLGRPWALLLGVGPALVLWIGVKRPLQLRASLWFSRASELSSIPPGKIARIARLPVFLRVLALVFMVLALARPQTFTESSRAAVGIDIMFVLDVSQSMEEQDLQRNRLDAGQRTLRTFLRVRHGLGDRIGLVAFAREAMLACPLTLDYRSLDSMIASLEIGEVPALGTAIGDALGLSLASLSRSESLSKVVILLSDGDWNKARFMDPGEARDLAVRMGVRVFTVLLGKEATRGPSGQRLQYGVNPDMLKTIAKDTGGLYFSAGSDEELERDFEAIRANLPQSETQVLGRVPNLQLFTLLLWPAFLLLLLELLLRMTRFRSFP